jgi:hypothetical protein
VERARNRHHGPLPEGAVDGDDAVCGPLLQAVRGREHDGGCDQCAGAQLPARAFDAYDRLAEAIRVAHDSATHDGVGGHG